MERVLCIDGLPSWMTSDQLRLLCSLYGDTLRTEIARDAFGRSLRFGIVEMATVEASEALVQALDGTDELDGTDRIVHVAQLRPANLVPHHWSSTEPAQNDLVLC